MVGYAEEIKFVIEFSFVEGAAKFTLGDDNYFFVDDIFLRGRRRGGRSEEEVFGAGKGGLGWWCWC